MAEKINIPSNTAICDKNGNVSIEWRLWFNKIYNRAGGADAMSNSELLAQINQTLETINGINTRIDGVESEIIGVNDSIASLNTNIADLDTRIDNVETKFDGIDSRLTIDETNIAVNIRDISNNTNSINTLTTRVSTAETNITNNTNAITGNTNSINALTTRVSTAETNITNNTNAITGNTNAITGNTNAITALTTRVSTAETNITTLNSNTIQTITNVGTGTGLYKNKSANNANFISLKAGLNVTFDTTDPNTLVINSSGGGGSSSTLSSLADVILTTPKKGDLLKLNGNKWVNDNNFRADAGKLKYFWRAVYGATSASSQGSWGIKTGGGGISYNNNTLLTKYGKWAGFDTYSISTTASAGATNAIYGASANGNRFKRWGNGSYSALVFILGVPMSLSSLALANTLCFCGITAEGLGQPLTAAEYTFASLNAAAMCVGWRPSDLNLQIVYKTTAGALTFIDLGSNFPVPNEAAGNKSAYEIIFYDMGSTTDVQIFVNRIDVNYQYSTVIQPGLATVGVTYYAPCIYFTTNEAVQKFLGVSSIETYQWVEFN